MGLRAGFIGLGDIGKPLASCWAKAGFPLGVYDLVDAAMAEVVALGATARSSAREVAAESDVVGICVRDDDDVRAVLLGDDGVFAGAKPGCLVMIHSTVQPATVVEMADAGAARGVGVVDVALTGGKNRAATGDLAVMVGGQVDAIEDALPILEVSASAGVFYCGGLGDGMRTKLCVNVVTYGQFLAGVEGLQLAMASGLDPENFIQVGLANGQVTPMMEQLFMVHKMGDELRKLPDIQNLVRGQKVVAEKDLAWAQRLAAEHGVALPGAALVATQMARVYGVEEEDE